MRIFYTAQSCSTIQNQRGYFNSLVLQALELLPGRAQLVQAKKQSHSALLNAHVYCYAMCYGHAMIINRHFSHLTVSICILQCI